MRRLTAEQGQLRVRAEMMVSLRRVKHSTHAAVVHLLLATCLICPPASNACVVKYGR